MHGKEQFILEAQIFGLKSSVDVRCEFNLLDHLTLRLNQLYQFVLYVLLTHPSPFARHDHIFSILSDH